MKDDQGIAIRPSADRQDLEASGRRPFSSRGMVAMASIVFAGLLATGCGADSSTETKRADSAKGGAAHGGSGEARRGGGGRPGGGPSGGHRGGPPGGNPAEEAGVPVRVAVTVRQAIALFFETNGTLEAENDVDLVARTTGPVVELKVEQGMRVRQGQLLARIDDGELRAQLAVARVRLEETRAAFERQESLFANELVSRDNLDSARASYETALGDVERFDIQLAYTEIKAPFSGVIAERYVRNAEYVNAGTQLFRISDFDPLLCPIQVPERELARLRSGQQAKIEVESWPGQRFDAHVARISPVVDAATGTIQVTLEVAPGARLRPGMFASVFLEMERRESALVIPKRALALDSLGDTVFVAADGVAVRRTVELGFENADQLEVVRGLAEGERVIVVGQDGLSDGTPIEVIEGDVGTAPSAPAVRAEPDPAPATDAPASPSPREARGGGPGVAGRGFMRNIDWNDPAQVERVKGFMRERGLNDAEIEDRLKTMRERSGGGSGRGSSGGSADGSGS